MALRVAMVGLGLISGYYAAALNELPELELAAVCDSAEARLLPYQRLGVHCDRDWMETLAREDVAGVMVNLPNDLHAEVCSAALSAGRHVCCEKPLALSTNDALMIDTASRDSGAVVFTAFHRRYNSNLVQMMQRLQGRPVVRASARYLERIEEHSGSDTWYLEPARCGGGCLADNGPNAFDVLRHLLGPLTVSGAELDRNGRGVDVRARVELRTDAGVPATVDLDWAYHGELKDVTLELESSETLSADLLAGYTDFKSSLYHEYVGVLRDFAGRVERGQRADDAGVEAVRMVQRAYSLASRTAVDE